jgi:phosphatidylinositol N-acetylglucosaminyltransferase subunit Q
VQLRSLLITCLCHYRGRKWNPLRQRLDSYDYTVEQHVVGSLLFTPVLLLIPTTSVFYIFFSILSTTIISLCVLLEIVVSVIHSTPYAELILWVMRRQIFPAGLVLLHVSSSCEHTYGGDGLSAHPARDCNEWKTGHLISGQPESLISELYCNYATLGKMSISTAVNLLPCDHEVMISGPRNSLL